MAITDLFRKYKSLHSTTLSASISTGTGETITFGSVTNVPTDTEVTMTIDRVDSSGTETPTKMERITGTVVGSALTSYTRAIDNTTDQAHSAGAVVEMVWNAKDLNDMVDGILVEHSQAGAHDPTVVTTLTASQTLINKTLTTPVIKTTLGQAETIADDDIYSFTPGGSNQGIMFLWSNSTVGYGSFIQWRAAATSWCTKVTGPATVEVTTGALTGTDGNDAVLTVSTHSDGKIYIENRLGATKSMSWIILSNS